MTGKRRIEVIVLSVAALICLFYGCSRKQAGVSPKEDEVPEQPVADIDAYLWEKADSALSTLTLEQRVGQCFFPALFSSSDPMTLRLFRQYVSDLHVGGILLHKGDLSSAAYLATEAANLDIPLFVAIDAEWGLKMRLQDAPGFPKNGEIDGGADEGLLFDYGREVARECRRTGINMVMGPVVDVVDNAYGIIGNRSFGADPRRVSDFGRAYALGLESGGVLSVAKHFPGHGSSNIDSHHMLPVINRNLSSLDSIDLAPFKDYIQAGLSGIMVGHLAVPAIDSTLTPAAMSKIVIDDLLRKKLGFKGLIITDALNMGGAAGYDSSDALKAGADIIVSPGDIKKEIAKTIEMVRRGEITEEEINSKCRKILYFKYLVENDEAHTLRLDGLREDINGRSDSIGLQLRYGLQ